MSKIDAAEEMYSALKKVLSHFMSNPRLYKVSGPNNDKWMPLVTECVNALAKAEVEDAMRAMNETGQGEHLGVTK